MPQSQIQGPDENARINLKSSVNSLGHLASGLARGAWDTRHAPSRTLVAAKTDVSARRAIEWHKITETVLQPYYETVQKNLPGQYYEVKKKIFFWFSRKHAVLQDALKKGDILQVDVLNAVLEIDILELEKRLGGTPSLAEDKVVKFRNEMQQADRTALEARHAEINKAFEDWQLNSSSHEPEKGSAVDHTYQFAVQQFPEVRNSDVCRSWPSDMAEMCRRMGEHWTAVELNSLHSFLTRFHHTLVKVSTPPRVESAYHPAARQCAANPEEVKQLFVKWNAAVIRTRVFGLASPLFETKPLLDVDIDPSRCTPAWLDDNWYRRLALPSTDSACDRITSLDSIVQDLNSVLEDKNLAGATRPIHQQPKNQYSSQVYFVPPTL